MLFAQPASAAPTLADLRADSKLTPERLLKFFANFKFELARTVRSPEVFLESQSGDCDDFATLAATLLREKGYTTRLVVVYMNDATHVVCYVAEIKGYLDFNRRQEASPLMACDAGLDAIGTSVAAAFKSQWRSVSEFTIQNGVRNFVLTEFR